MHPLRYRCALVAACMVVTTAESVRSADPPRYRVTRIGALDNLATEALNSNAFGLNNLDQVVGWSEFVAAGQTRHRAFLWLPEPSLGLSEGIHNLGILSLGSGSESEARDINDAGNIAGWSGQLGNNTRGFLWFENDPPGPLSQGLNALPPLFETSTGESEAWDISDTVSPLLRVVGWSQNSGVCRDGTLWTVQTGFAPVVEELPSLVLPGETTNFDTAFAVNPNVPSLADIEIAGSAAAAPLCSVEVTCFPGVKNDVPVVWNEEAMQIVVNELDMASDGLDAITGQSRGVRDDGALAGFADEDTGGGLCKRRAAFWPDKTSPVDNIHGSFASSAETFAEAIRNNADEIVGWITGDTGHPSGNAQRALRWEKSGSQWVARELNEEVSSRYHLLRAYDIGETGSIAVVLEFQLSPGNVKQQAGLLTLTAAETCPEDVNDDGNVDQADLALVNSNQGECPPAVFCWEDVNWDSVVDQQDQEEVIRAFGTCGGSGSTQMSSEMINVWLTAGGADGMSAGTISAQSVADSIDEPTAADEFAALMSLIE